MFILSQILTYIKTHKRTTQVLIPLLVFVFLCVGCYHLYNKRQIEKPVIVTQQQAKSPKDLAKAIHVTEKQAQEVISIKERTQPVATYYTQAPTVEKAAEKVKQDIAHSNPNLPKAATEKSDRTAVVANTEEQKVDVYKIKLDKPHSILAGVTVMTNGEVYETVGYEDKRFEGLAHFKGSEFKGASALVKVVRW